MLDGHQDSSAESCRNLRYILFRYANECETVPSTLFISGPKFQSTERPTQGEYSDVYRGSFDDKPVAMKTLRVPQNVSSQSFKVWSIYLSSENSYAHTSWSDVAQKCPAMEADKTPQHPPLSWAY